MADPTLKPFTGTLDEAPPEGLKPFAGTLDGEAPKRTIGGTARDIGVTALKGAVGLPQAVVGLADIPTGGRVGKALEGAGLRFKDAQDSLDTMYSPAQQEANRKVRDADGFIGTAKAMLENPSTIATGVGESLPQMLGGAGVARGLLAAAPKLGAVAAGALGEGVMGAGSAAEQLRQQTDDGLLTGKQAALAGASGVSTAALGALGGRVAQRLGVGDVDTMLAQGSARAAGQGSKRSMARQVLEGAVAEGALEEMPQSVAEQALQNVALDRQWSEGLGAAAAQGLITGAAMGGAGGGVGASANRARLDAAVAPANEPAPLLLGNTPDPMVSFPDGTVGRRAEVEAYIASLPADQQTAARARLYGYAPEAAEFTTSPGAADPAAIRTQPAAPVEALQADTTPGAQPPRDGIDFTREFDDGGLTLVDTAEAERARAATIDYEPTPITPQWDTSAGAAPAREPGLDMPAPEIDTGGLALDTRTPSQRMGIDPAAGPLSRVAAQAVDAAPANEPQALANAPASGGAPQQVAALTQEAPSAINSEAKSPQSFTNGAAREPQADQAQQATAQPSQGRAAPAGQPAGQELIDGGTAAQNIGAQAAPATGTQGQATAATPAVTARPDNWRTSMLRAGPVAKGLGIDTKGKRLAQVVAEIDAADAQRAGVPQDGADLAAGQIDREWSAFAPETGTLGVPRAEMPQIKAEHRGALVNFLKARGIGSRAAEVPANDLKPTQAEFSPSKVAKARAFQGGDRSILVSSDGYVVDGHHQWLAKRANGEPVKVIRLQAPIRQVLAQVAEFPSTAAARGASEPTGAPDAATPRDLRLADERAASNAPAAAAGPGQPAGRAPNAQPAGSGGGRAAESVAGVQPAVPGRGSTGQPAAGVVPQRGGAQAMTPELARTLLELSRPRQSATKDSVRAAVRELVKGMGSLSNQLGRVVVATSQEIKQEWEPLTGPVQLDAAEGGQTQGFYDPKTNTVFLIADHIREGDELGVVAHELMHKHGQAVLGEEGWNRLHATIGGWASAPEGSLERRVYDEAAARVQASGPELSTQELFPYAVQVALEMGVKPNLVAPPGTVARWLGHVRVALRQVWGKITGKPDSFNSQDLVNLAFGIAQRENPAHRGELDGTGAEAGNVLAELSRMDDLFQVNRSAADSVEGIAADVNKAIKVKRVQGIPGRQEYELTMPSGDTATLSVRPPNPYGDTVYGFDLEDGEMANMDLGRPGDNPQDVPPGTEDVWIDASRLAGQGEGLLIYAIAANYAHNTGRIFIGDPAGLSDQALRRRSEQMLSSALKFGTTRHLAPHPRQVRGDSRVGVPPLKWVYGDDLGNIRRLIDLNLQAMENAGETGITFDPQSGTYLDSDRNPIDRDGISLLADGGYGRNAGAGRTTLARRAVLDSLLRGTGEAGRGGNGRSDALLANLLGLAHRHPAATEGLFYSRGVAASPATGDYTPAQQRAAERAFGTITKQTWAERAQSMRANLGTKLRQGLVDQFAPIKEVSQKAYMLARLSKGSDGAVEAALLYGKPYLRDGVYDVDMKDGGFAQVLASLQGEHDRFFQWVAAQRAERLKAGGKENLLTDQDISDLKTLNAGHMADGSPRMPAYAAALRELNAFNEASLKVAKESGLIDQAAYELMKDQPYVPGVERNIQRFMSVLPGNDGAKRARTIETLSSMVGALVLARATAAGNPALSEEILATLREQLAP